MFFFEQLCKVNKRTQELIQSDPHQAPNTKGNTDKYNTAAIKAELATPSQKGGNSDTQTQMNI